MNFEVRWRADFRRGSFEVRLGGDPSATIIGGQRSKRELSDKWSVLIDGRTGGMSILKDGATSGATKITSHDAGMCRWTREGQGG